MTARYHRLFRPLLATALILTTGAATAAAATRTSVASGDWSNPATWSTGVPVNGDNVIIASGTNVRINVNTASIGDIIIQTGGTLRGDGTGKALLFGRGGGEDMTNSGTLDLSGANRARLRLARASQWGGSGGVWLLDTLELNNRTVTFTAGSSFTLRFTGGGMSILTPGGITGIATVTFAFAGLSPQTLPASTTIVYGALHADNTAGVSLGTALTTTNLLGDCRVLQGTLSDGGFGITGNAARAFEVAAGAHLFLASTTGMVSGFASRTLHPASTVEYGGTGQSVSTESYGHLRLSGSGTKTLPASPLTVAGDFTLGGTASASASSPLSVAGAVSIEPGASFDAGSFAHSVGGDWSNGGTFTPNTSTITMQGTSVQSIAGSSFHRLTLDNATGFVLLSDLAVADTLRLAAGVVSTGAFRVSVGFAGAVIRVGGHVAGRLQKPVTVATPVVVFEVGDASTYSPLVAAFSGVTSPGSLTVQAVAAEHPQIGASELDSALSVNRYYQLSNDGVAFSTYAATCTFTPVDLDAGVDTARLTGSLFDGSVWTIPDAGTRTGTSVEVPALTAVGDIALGVPRIRRILASASAGGTITPSGTVLVPFGDDQSFTITPNMVYHIDSVVVDGVNQGAVGSYTFSNVNANHTIAAYFSIDQFVITASASSGGSISPNGTVFVSYGDSQSFTVTPNTGYHIDSVVVDGVSQGSVGSYTFTNVTANHTISAYFSIDQFTITASASAGGSISPSGSVAVTCGNDQSFTVTPNTGYHIDSVLVDGVNQGAVGSYTFTNVTANHSIATYFSIDQFTITASASAGGSISPSGSVTVTYGSDQSFTVTPNTGYHIDSVLVDGVNQGAVGTFTFSNVTANHTIAAYFSIDQFTITASASAGGSISPSGSVSVSYGDSQSFTVTPNTGYHIDSVLVDGVNQGAVGTYTFSNVTANHSIATYFSIDQFTITASASAGGSISPSGTTTVSYGDSQSFTATPNTGYHIDSVVVDGVNQGAVGSYTFTNVTSNHSIAAYFSIDQFTITASASAGGSISPSGTVFVSYGDNQSFTVAPNTGYHIDSVLVDGVSQGAVGTYTFSNVTSNHSIAAYFSIDQFTITASASAGGSISPSGTTTVSYGDSQSFTVTPNTGYHIDSVLVDGVNQGAVGTYTFSNVTANHTIAVYFSIDQFTITASASAGGSISPSGTTTVSYGDSQSFTVTPNTGYHIDSVLVDGVNQGAVGTYTFSNVTSNHSIAAYFSIDQFTITASASAGGSISPSGTTTVSYGDSQSFTVTPNTGYHVDSVVVDGVNQGAVGSHTFSNVTASHTIAAYFSIDQFTITTSASAGGSISPSGSVSVSYGDNVSFTVTPNTGYHIDSVLVDGVSQGAVGTYTFTNVTANHTISAYFSIDQFTITASASAGGSISPSGSVAVTYGNDQSFTVTTNTGYHIDSVLVDGVNQGAVGSYTFTNVTANHTISAYFSIDQFTITASASAGGSISPSGTITVTYGTTALFLIAPEPGYEIADVQVDNASVGPVPAHIFTAVAADHAIHASFQIQQVTMPVSVDAGWNLVSVPVLANDFRASTLLPSAAGPAFAYQGVYVQRDTLANGEGYWVKFPAERVLMMTGAPLPVDTIDVRNGWNLIGVPETILTTAQIGAIGTSVVSRVFDFDRGFRFVDTLRPGGGYLLKTSPAGRLVLGGAATPETFARVAAVRSVHDALHRLIVTDASGNAQTLLFGSGAADDEEARVLPPMPPEGAFDVRFTDNTMAALLAEGPEAGRRTISVQGAAFPLTIHWSVAGDSLAEYRLEYSVGGRSHAVTLAGDRECVIPAPVLLLSLNREPVQMPGAFALLGNFPNPFNPSTTIAFAVPYPSRVRVVVFDQLGREVGTIVDEQLAAGHHRRVFEGAGLASGVYYYRMTAGSFTAVGRMLLMK